MIGSNGPASDLGGPLIPDQRPRIPLRLQRHSILTVVREESIREFVP